jgi:phytoene dehydrogenase-like protein
LPESEKLDYSLWLPDRKINLYHEKHRWRSERLKQFGDTPQHVAFWEFMDRLADVFWSASRKGIKLPIQSIRDVFNAIDAVGVRNLFMCRYINHTFLEALRKYHLENDTALRTALAMLVEDTVHSSVEEAPLINAALGITIRGAGLRRACGGMKGLWDHLRSLYKERGGKIVFGNRIERIENIKDVYHLASRKGTYLARKVVSAIPVEATYHIADDTIQQHLERYFKNRDGKYGGAIVVFLGVPDEEVANHEITHHQLLQHYDMPFGNGNNMFISVSAAGDTKSAPAGYRAVMISTHCDLDEWQNLDSESYERKKRNTGEQLVNFARRVYPNLGDNAVIYQVGTPSTYRKYTGRPSGSVGGIKQTIRNANFGAIPHDIGVKNFRVAGDTTWPGLGTVACILGSRIVADQLQRES